jgi:hypothetical protein
MIPAMAEAAIRHKLHKPHKILMLQMEALIPALIPAQATEQVTPHPQASFNLP